MTRPVIIGGFMGTGKSTVAPLLAKRLGLPFVDTDSRLAEEQGLTIADLWRTHGEPRFRELEAELVRRVLLDPKPHVIAVGGGALVRRATRHLALDAGFVVTLEARPSTIVARIGDPATRPLLAAASPTEASRERIADLLALRSDGYDECHLRVHTDDLTPEQVVLHVLAGLERDPLVVPLGRRTYVVDVVIDAPTRLAEEIARLSPSRILAVTDANVQRARGRVLDDAVAALGVPHARVALPPGEQHKTLASVGALWDAALGAGVDRDAVVLGYGGGVVGDLAGFAASTLLRGVRFVLAPTTLLAMVDASVGGKTGFDHPAGKNLIGTFHQPSAVVADLGHLSTLPARERAAGLAEVVKIALLADAELLGSLERDAAELDHGSAPHLAPVVRRAIAAKARFVRDDEREESGRRALLNLGHTIGHALEAFTGYMRYRHGEAVALGMLEELRMSSILAGAPSDLAERTKALLARLGLPTEVPRADLAAAWPFVERDKKRRGARVEFPIVSLAGSAALRSIPLDDLRKAALGVGG